ncbi:MAG: PQQ-like beta-propeller repeat protein [Clostridia bacterium]|nr:PQQ-like beta-propeller repeat protein [Clostridia bacterium]
MSAIALTVNKILSVIFAVIFIPFSALTHGIDLLSAGERTDSAKTNVVGIGAYFRSQGITTDGETLYFSSKTTLIRTEDDARTLVNANYSAIPDELKELGIKHIGGLSYYNGKIYAGLEDSKVWDYPIVGVFDANTLELVEYYIMDAKKITRGLPWVCVDSQTGYLYCTDHSKNPTKLFAYDTADKMKLVKEVDLKESPYAIQGAEILDGIIYAATNDDTQAVYKINPADGGVEKVFDRNLTAGSEGEGMTFMKKNGETVIVAMDMGPLFINAFVRDYNFD